MKSETPCKKCKRFVELTDIAWFYNDDDFECRSCRYGLLLDEAANTFWKAYNAESAMCAMVGLQFTVNHVQIRSN